MIVLATTQVDEEVSSKYMYIWQQKNWNKTSLKIISRFNVIIKSKYVHLKIYEQSKEQ